VATTGWAVLGAGALTQSTDDPPFGTFNLKDAVTAGVNDGCNAPAFSATDTVTYTASLYFKGASTIPYRMYIANAGAANSSTDTDITGDGTWHRYEVTYVAEATESLFVCIRKDNDTDTDAFYVDALQVESGTAATTYLDGSLSTPSLQDYAWSGVAHASTSTRWPTVRSGGSIKNLTDDYYFYVTNPVGTGMAPVTNYRTPYALLDGSLHEHTKINDRTFILNGDMLGTSLENLHTRRSALYNILKPDIVSDQPVIIQYTGGAETVQIAAYYDGGMDGGIVEGFSEKMGLRFYAPAPDWLEVIT